MSVPTPRARLRVLLRGRRPAPPLFVPLVHAAAARVEEIEPAELVTNATKLAKALTALHRAIESDGIVVCCSAGLEAEAAGAELEWSTYPPRLVTRPQNPADDAGRLVAHPRVATAIEVVRRLRATEGEPLLVAALAGPLALAGMLRDDPSAEAVELAGRIALVLARELCQAGVDAVFLLEERAPPAADPTSEVWRGALATLAKVVRFHQAIPALVVPESSSVAAEACAAPGGPIRAATLPAAPESWSHPAPGSALVTTAAEVSWRVDLGEIRAACARVRTALDSSS